MFGATSFVDDALEIDSLAAQFRADLIGGAPPANDTYAIGMTLGAGRPGQRQLALYALESTTHVYYCDLDGSQAPASTWGESFTTDGTSYVTAPTVAATGPLENGPATIAMTHEPPEYSCVTSWPADSALLAGSIPPGITPDHVAFGAIGLVVRFDYFIWIHSD